MTALYFSFEVHVLCAHCISGMIFKKLLSHPDIISGRAIQQLSQFGFSVIDGALDNSCARTISSEIKSLGQSGRLHLNSTQVLVDSDPYS